MRMRHGQKFFPAQHGKVREEVRVAVQHQHAQLCGKFDAVDLILPQIIRKLWRVQPYFVGQNMYLCADTKRTDDVCHRSIEGKCHAVGIAPSRLIAKIIYSPGHIRPQGALAYDDALGFAGGTGGVNHISAVAGRRPVQRLRRAAVRHETRCSRLVQRHTGPGVLQHVRYAFFRVRRVNGHIGRAGLLDADDRRDEFLHAVHLYGHKTVFSDTALYKAGGDPV